MLLKSLRISPFLPITCVILHTTISLFSFFILLYKSSIILLFIQSSASTNMIYSPFDSSIPLFLVLIEPSLLLFITFILLSFSSYFLQIFRLLSVEPSFINNISICLNDWFIIDFIHLFNFSPALYIGTITLTLFIFSLLLLLIFITQLVKQSIPFFSYIFYIIFFHPFY